MPDGAGDGRWLTYDEIAAVRGTQRVGAIRWVQRHKWRRQPGNDGLVRVLVPPNALTPTTPPRRSTPTVTPDSAAAFTSAVAAIKEAHAGEVAALREHLTARAEQAEQGREAADARADRAEATLSAERARADELRQRIDALTAGQALMAEEGKQAEIMRAQVDELQVDLAAARDRAEQAETDAAKLREAEIRQRARGLVARLKAAWRGE